MKILVHIGLSDRSMKNHVLPLTMVDDVDEIIIVRDVAGPSIPKVKYYPTNKKNKILKIISRFLMMLKVCKNEKPEYIHAYMLFPWGILAYITSKLCGTKFGISLIAGPVEVCTFGGSPIGKYPYNQPQKLKVSWIHKIINLKIIKDADVVTVTGNFTKKFLIKNNIDNEKIFIIPHKVDSNFTPREMTKEFDVIYVGRLAKVKHVETLIKAIKIVKRQYEKIRVAIVGNGPEKRNLENLVKKYGLSNNIYFAGYRDDVWNWLNKSKIFVLTSEREGFPYAIIEAMACGVPVITTDCGDVKDLIKHNYNGLILKDYKDAYQLSKYILYLLKNPEVRKMYANRSLKIVNKITYLYISKQWKEIIEFIRKN